MASENVTNNKVRSHITAPTTQFHFNVMNLFK